MPAGQPEFPIPSDSCSLLKISPWNPREFPANREKYREFLYFLEPNIPRHPSYCTDSAGFVGVTTFEQTGISQ
jgi:hypothetical protein